VLVIPVCVTPAKMVGGVALPYMIEPVLIDEDPHMTLRLWVVDPSPNPTCVGVVGWPCEHGDSAVWAY
jgi:hypothetical protein